jgi:hypothetical protein
MLVSSGFSDIRFVPPNSDDHGSYAEGWRALFTARIRVWGEGPEKSAGHAAALSCRDSANET